MRGSKERQRVPAGFSVRWPPPHQPFCTAPMTANSGVTIHCAQTQSYPHHGLPALLNLAPPAHASIFFPLLHSVIHLPHKRSTFCFWVLCSHYHVRKCAIPTSKPCCSGCSMSNQQPGNLWGSSVAMEFFNTDLDRKFQSSLGLAQGKAVKWGISSPPHTTFLCLLPLCGNTPSHLYTSWPWALQSCPGWKVSRHFLPSISHENGSVLCSIPLNTIPTSLITMACKTSAQKEWPAVWFSGTRSRQACSRAPLHSPRVGSPSSQSWHLQDQTLRLH